MSQVFEANLLITNVGFWIFVLFLIIFIISIFCFLANGFSYVNTYPSLIKNKKNVTDMNAKIIVEEEEFEDNCLSV